MTRLPMATCDQLAHLETGIARHLHKVRMRFLTKTIAGIKKEKGSLRILDIGCGDGAVTKYVLTACDSKDKVICLDMSRLRLNRAKKLLGDRVKLIIGDAKNLKFPSNSFNVVLMHHVIEHIPGDDDVLKDVHRVLTKGGYILIGVPHEGGAIGKILRAIHRGMYRKSQHVNFYTTGAMTKQLKAAGFRGVVIGRFGLLFPFYPIHWLILTSKPLFDIGDWVTQKFGFTADSLFFVAKK